MAEAKRIVGPSPEARERIDRLVLALYDADEPLTLRQALDRLSDYMSRADGEAAVRRMFGAELIGFVPDASPRRMGLMERGRGLAERIIARGGSY